MGALVYDDARAGAGLLRQTMTDQQIKTNYSVIKSAHILFAVLSFGMMFTFLMFWWQGVNLDVIFSHIGINIGVIIFLGLVFSAAIATGEYAVYKDAFSDKLVLWAKIGVIFLCILSDVGVNMDREDERVRNLSADSPALTAATKAVEASASSSASANLPPGYQKALSDQQSAFEWVNGKCEATHASKGNERIQKCIKAEQAKLDAANQTISTLSASMGAIAQAQEIARGANQAALIGQIKDLQHDEANNAHPLVKLVTYITSAEFIFSSMMVSLFVMVPPQLLFMAVGRILLRYEMALGMPSDNKAPLNLKAALCVDTQDEPATQEQQAALNRIWNAIDTSVITTYTVRDNGEPALLLNQYGHAKTSPEIRVLLEFITDALLKEGVLTLNPDYVEGEKNGRKTKYSINPNRKIKYQST